MKIFKTNKIIVAPLLMVLTFIPFLANAKTIPIPNKNKNVSIVNKAKTVAVDMVVNNFSFSPSVINAKQGDTIKIKLTGADAEHSFYLPAFKVNIAVMPGKTKTFSFKVTKKGTFSYTCHIPCGSGHKDMKGTVVVS
jgi:cytochrome c oxidase subunit 2